MLRPLRSLASGLALALVLSSSSLAVVSLVGCDDPRSMDWQLKHLEDTDPMKRSQAVDGINQAWRSLDQATQSPDEKEKAAAEKQRTEFSEKAIPDLVKAYSSDALKDSSKDRKKIMDVLASADDVKAKPAFVHALKSYKQGENEDEVKLAARAIQRMAKDFKGDDDIAKALLAALKQVKFSVRASGELGALFADDMSAIKATSIKSDLLAIVTGPNTGEMSPANKELTARQAIAAQVLGDVGGASEVGPLIDTMFTLASTMIVGKDATGGDLQAASQLTSGVAQVISGSLARIGKPAIAPLMPYVKDDASDPNVAKVKAKFKSYTGPNGSDPTAYVKIATATVANIGLPEVATQVAGIVRDKKTKDDDRKPLIGLLVSLPVDADIEAAIKEGYANTTTSSLKALIAGSVSRTMVPDFTDWLIGIGGDAKADDDTKQGALTSAIWLAPADKMGALKDAFIKAKLDGKPDQSWRVMEETDKVCDPAKLTGADKDRCAESQSKKGSDGKAAMVLWDDKTPKYGDELAIVTELTTKCAQDAKCYLDAFKTAVTEVDKQGFTKVTLNGTKAGIRAQKAIWMLAAYGKEDDMLKLVQLMPTIESPAPRSFVQMALDRNLKDGSIKVADAITKIVKEQREKGSETANREAGQLEPIASKLRARAGGSKK